MGLLAAAAKKKEGESGKRAEGKKPEKKHPAAQIAQSVAPSDVDAEAGDSQDAGDEGDAAAPQGDDAESALQGGGDQAGDAQGGQPEAADDAGQPADGGQDDDQSNQEGGAQDDSPMGVGSDDNENGGAGQDSDVTKVPMSPALTEEMHRLNAALYHALYQNDQVAQAVLSGIQPDGPHKIESVARVASLMVMQINKQLHFVQETPQLVLPFTRDVTMHVLDLAQQVKKIQFSPQEGDAALGAALETVMRAVGVTKKQMQQARQIIPRSQLQQHAQNYKTAAAQAKATAQANAQQGESPPGAGSGGGQTAPDARQAPPAGGQQSPPGGPGGQPQPGAPVTAAPGPGQSAPPGGMLTQAQAPGGQ